jgi:adenosylhomocysteinase
MRIRGMHGRVIVTEVNPVPGLEALADGFQVMRMDDAAAIGDVFMTCTGAEGVITARHFQKMRNNVLLVNAGALENEVDVSQLADLAKRRFTPRPGIESFELANGHQLHLLADGRVANVAVGEGHPVEIMDLTYAVQALSLYYLAQADGRLEPGLHRLPAEMDEEIARLALKANGGVLDAVAA